MEDQTSEEEVKVDGETPTNETDTTETGGEANPQKEEIDYKTKFSESSREAQRLMEENKRLAQEYNLKDKELADAQEERKRFEEEIANANPEQLDAFKMRKSIEELQKSVVLEREERELTQFTASNPEAAKHKEVLRKLGRAEKKSYNELWNENFKDLYGELTAEKSKADKKSRQPETGKGSATNMEGGFSLDAFSKMSLIQQKEYLKKQGY
jgi:predicted RNase H-like nuclease (RuvC/YqgF family)